MAAKTNDPDSEFFLDGDVYADDDLERSKSMEDRSSSTYSDADDAPNGLGGRTSTFTSQQWPQSYR